MTVRSLQTERMSRRPASPDTGIVPEFDIRIAALTICDGRLMILIDRDGEGLSLPRSGPMPSEPIDVSARNSLRDLLGYQEQYLEQLYTLSVQESGIWKVIISYVALISSVGIPRPTSSGEWVELSSLDYLSEGDSLVVDYALFRIRAKLDYTTIGFNLLPAEFTLSELQSAYETVLGRKLDKRNFRRRMTALGILSVTGSTRRDGSHRPARLYRFNPDRDPTDYLTPPWATAQEVD